MKEGGSKAERDAQSARGELIILTPPEVHGSWELLTKWRGDHPGERCEVGLIDYLNKERNMCRAKVTMPRCGGKW
jgi:hypothetical protein